jgi:hypothetical protein
MSFLLKISSLLVFLILFGFNSYAAPESYKNISIDDNCTLNNDDLDKIIAEVKKHSDGAIRDLVDCLKLNRKLILQASLADPTQFQYAADFLKEDENFIYRLIKISPEILKYISPNLLLDEEFMKNTTYLNRDSLKYADPKLLDNKLFMTKMIKIDYKNYIYASSRLKEIKELAELALNDNGLYLEYAPDKIKDDKKLVTIAVKSNIAALNYASERLKKDKELQKLLTKKSSIISTKLLEEFLQKNYLDSSNKKNIGLVIANRMKFFAKNKIIDRNYVTKWQKFFTYNNDSLKEGLKLISADSHNYAISWKEDFKKYPDLIKKIEDFFLNRGVDQTTIDSLSTTYLWKVKSNDLTLVFNLYLLRDSKYNELSSDFANVNSLTAIVQKQNGKWKMTVLEVIFDSEIKMDIAFKDGHKKFDLWDLYIVDKKDKNPKIIFKTEERFREFFEIFEEQSGGKYQMIYKTDFADAKENLSY